MRHRRACGLCPQVRTIEINADENSFALKLSITGQALERLLSCIL